MDYRNPGHWDIYDSAERCFRIRGETGAVFVHDERADGPPYRLREPGKFKTVTAAMTWIADEMMTA